MILEHDIAELDVSVDNALFMSILKRLACLQSDPNGLLRRKETLRFDLVL
jgi:hypothetical protein